MIKTIQSKSNIFFKKNGNFWEMTMLNNIRKDDIFRYTTYGQTFSFQNLNDWKALRDAANADVYGKSVGNWEIEAERI